MESIRTCLWFNRNAEEAVGFYTSIFKHSSVGTVTHYGEAGAKVSGQPDGSVMTITFVLEDQEEEVDEFWNNLSNGGAPGQCEWLMDKFGVSWQVVPTALGEMLQENPEKSEKVMEALIHMNKLDIEALKYAYTH